ncbi:MAG TPA: asparagine synthase-related protein [Candidatus Sulfotelmatobacter sp.]|nr:asparagine synthase-related protein [Candidatus Sulfotelmatobacter sp.]
MSGFFGMVRQDGSAVDIRFLEAIAEELRFRGQDGVTVWTEGGIGGCFVRMQTGPARQAETQPVSLAGRYWLWGDMRLDGREELRRQLAESDSTLSTDPSSEELFLVAWKAWGDAALAKVLGDFSLSLWDASEQTLWCARDFVGARPLYYARVGPVFCFSNTLQILRRVSGISGGLDEDFVGEFLLTGWSTDPERTVYRDIRRLPAGHVLKFAGGKTEVRRFRKLPIEEPLRLKRPEEYLEGWLDLLRLAVKDRLPAGAAALYLSGGLDSSSVCALAAKLAEERGQRGKLKAFTVSWESFLDDQEPTLAKLTAKHLGLAHEVLQEPGLVPFEGAEKMETRAPEPGPDFFFAREQRQYRRIASHANVVLSGDGGDDVLTGQGWPYLVHLWGNRDWKRIARDYGGYFVSHGRFPPLRGGFRTRLSRLMMSEGSFEGYPTWLNEEFETRANLKQRWLELKNTKRCQEHPLHPRAYDSLHRGYWASVLEAEDAGWNRVRLETRAPFLDLRVLQFQLQLPPVPWCVDKELIRLAMRDTLPAAIVKRPKTPLPMDPEVESMDRCDWSGLLLEEVPEGLKGFVKWEKWCETFCAPKGSLSLMQLRPLSLLHWLKAVEMTKGIQ